MSDARTKDLVCTRCEGTGSIPPAWPVGPGGAHLDNYECHICNGTGRVRITPEGAVSVMKAQATEETGADRPAAPVVLSSKQAVIDGLLSMADRQFSHEPWFSAEDADLVREAARLIQGGAVETECSAAQAPQVSLADRVRARFAPGYKTCCYKDGCSQEPYDVGLETCPQCGSRNLNFTYQIGREAQEKASGGAP